MHASIFGCCGTSRNVETFFSVIDSHATAEFKRISSFSALFSVNVMLFFLSTKLSIYNFISINMDSVRFLHHAGSSSALFSSRLKFHIEKCDCHWIEAAIQNVTKCFTDILMCYGSNERVKPNFLWTNICLSESYQCRRQCHPLECCCTRWQRSKC